LYDPEAVRKERFRLAAASKPNVLNPFDSNAIWSVNPFRPPPCCLGDGKRFVPDCPPPSSHGAEAWFVTTPPPLAPPLARGFACLCPPPGEVLARVCLEPPAPAEALAAALGASGAGCFGMGLGAECFGSVAKGFEEEEEEGLEG